MLDKSRVQQLPVGGNRRSSRTRNPSTGSILSAASAGHTGNNKSNNAVDLNLAELDMNSTPNNKQIKVRPAAAGQQVYICYAK